MTWKSRKARLCGIDLRPVPGLIRHYDRFPTADAVGYDLSPFGLDGGIRSKSIVQHHEQNSQRAIIFRPSGLAAKATYIDSGPPRARLSTYATARARISLGSRISAPPQSSSERNSAAVRSRSEE